MKRRIFDVSPGTRFVAAQDGEPFLCIIVKARHGDGTDPTRATITVRTSDPVRNGAKLTIPELPETGGCGLAEPRQLPGGITFVDLQISYSCVDVTTLQENLEN